MRHALPCAADAPEGITDRACLLRRDQPGRLHAWRDEGIVETGAGEPGLSRSGLVRITRRHRAGLSRLVGPDRRATRHPLARAARHHRGGQCGRDQWRVPGAGDPFRAIAGAADRAVAGTRRCRCAARSRCPHLVAQRQILGDAAGALPVVPARQCRFGLGRARDAHRSPRQAVAADPLALVRAAWRRCWI